jgi:hypothetical protein
MRFQRVTGIRSGLLVLMITAAAFAALKPSHGRTSAAAQVEIAAPPDKKSMEKFMALKLAAAQRALEGVSREDHEMIQKATAEMIELSRQAAWGQMASYRYVQDTTDFVAAAEFLSRMADAKDPEGTSLGFMRLTMTCTNCHRHVRTASVAKLDEEPGPLGTSLIASSSREETTETTAPFRLNSSAEYLRTEHRKDSETR